MPNQPTPATDSASELHALIGDDATATFESNPTFLESNPTGSASSENLEEQRPGAGKEFRGELAAAPASKGAGPDDDEEADELEDDDHDYEDEDEDDVEDEDDDEDDEDFEDDDDDEDEEDEDDDADEVKASASSASSPLRADGLLGYEDEAEDSKNGVDRVTGDVLRERDQARKLSDDPDENPDDANAEVNPEALKGREDSNVWIRPVKPADGAGLLSAMSF